MAPSTNRSGHRPFKAAMLGSNPAGVTNIVPWCSWLTYLPVTQEIAGSIPVGTATRPLSLIGQDAGLSILKCRVQIPQGSPLCLRGGTGIHVRLKIGRREDWGFESLGRHHARVTESVYVSGSNPGVQGHVSSTLTARTIWVPWPSWLRRRTANP